LPDGKQGFFVAGARTKRANLGGGLLLPTSRHAAIFAEVAAELPHLRGNILHDVHTAVLMREHGIRDLYTRDAEFSRFPFLRVIDPIAS